MCAPSHNRGAVPTPLQCSPPPVNPPITPKYPPKIYLGMLARGRRLLQPLFGGRLLLLTNTASSGALLAAGDTLQQAWHLRHHPEDQRQAARTGDKA